MANDYYPDLVGVPNGNDFDILSNYLDLDSMTINKESMQLEIPNKNNTCKLVLSIKE